MSSDLRPSVKPVCKQTQTDVIVAFNHVAELVVTSSRGRRSRVIHLRGTHYDSTFVCGLLSVVAARVNNTQIVVVISGYWSGSWWLAFVFEVQCRHFGRLHDGLLSTVCAEPTRCQRQQQQGNCTEQTSSHLQNTIIV